MKALKKKISMARLGRKKEDDNYNGESTQQGRKSSVGASTDRDEPRNSTASTTFDSIEENKLNILEASDITPRAPFEEIPPPRDGSLYQPFNRDESPYTIGRHGLYVFGESDELPLPLLPATPGLEYGMTRPVELPPEPFLQPGEICKLQEVLIDPPPEPPKPPSLMEKLSWKTQQARALLQNPKADPKFAMLPKGLNNRVDSEKKARQEEPFKEKVRRAFTPKKAATPVLFQLDQVPPLPVEPLAASSDFPTLSDFGASPRFCPKIAPQKFFERGPEFDDVGNPFGGEQALFLETEEERERRIKRAEEARAHRKASDHYLSLVGQRQINNPVIGRPPPLSQRQLAEPVKLTEKRVKELQEQMKEAKKATEFEEAVRAWGIHEARYEANRAKVEELTVLREAEVSAAGAKHNTVQRQEELIRSGRNPEKERKTNGKTIYSARAATNGELPAASIPLLPKKVKIPIPNTVEGHETNPPLPKKGARYFQWDNAMLAGKMPIILPPATPPASPLPKAPDNSPPPVPSAQRIEHRQASPILDSLGISGNFGLNPSEGLRPMRKQGSQRDNSTDYSDSESDYSDTQPLKDEQQIFKAQQTLTKNSEKFAQSYSSEVDLAHEEVSTLSLAVRWAEKVATQLNSGGQNPFDIADNERRRNWALAETSLTGQYVVTSPSFTLQRLSEICPHLTESEQDIEEIEDDDTPRRVGGGGETIGSACSISSYHPTPNHKETEGNYSYNPYSEESLDPNRQLQPEHSCNPYSQEPSESNPRLQPLWHELVESSSPLHPPYPPWKTLQQQQGKSRSGNVVDLKRYDFVDEDDNEDADDDDYIDDDDEDVAPPSIPARSPMRRPPGRRISSQRGRFPVIPSVQSSGKVSATMQLSHTKSPSLPASTPSTNKGPGPPDIRQRHRGFAPLVLPTQDPRPLPPLPLRLAQPQPPKKTSIWKKPSFLGSTLTVSGVRPAKMESKLQVRPSEFSSVKTKAVEDARQMQATVLDVASKTGKDPPKYVLLELIGKGSFGRVYKGKDMTSAAIVAVKIIDIDESDTLSPRNADSYSDFLKEVNALKILSESNARNINHVIEALPVGQAMWMISEYCGGGSIATLMKPTAPGGLQEKWIIPILREVAEAIKWVHQAGIIHRDIKCANVLITEEGGVQLCDFGVAGIIENKVDKRSTVIGTPHWMAPELFSATPYYGKEVDIWAFGSMVFEIATGLPPNVANGVTFERLGSHLQHHIPRLEGGSYSNELRDLVAYCLEELPSSRPTIEQVQKHPYIYSTNTRYPASSLSNLVRAFKMWEDHGGSRKSLFMVGGAQGPSEGSNSVADDEWNFSTTAAFDQEVLRQSTPEDVFEAYGKGVALQGFFAEETSRPPQKASRRRPPPEALARLPAPLEKIFDPNTLSNYEDNSRNHYGRPMQTPASDLPLRDATAQTSIRDTMIDLGGHDSDTGLSNFPDMDTIKANRRGREEPEDEYMSTLHNFSRPALSDPADVNPNRRTQDWKFPSMAPPASADPEISRFPISYDLPRPAVTPASGGRPALIHHPTEPIGAAFAGSLTQQATMDRISMRESLIDLDMSMPDVIPAYSRPSTANSDAGSATSEQMASGNPFELERHTSLYAPLSSENTEITEPDYYTGESTVPARLRSNSAVRPQDITEISDFSASDAESGQDRNGYSDSDFPPLPLPTQPPFPRPANQPYTFAHFPDLPAPPSERALSGTASHEEMKDEFNRMLGAMTSQLESFKDVYSSPQITQRMGPMPQRRDKKDGEAGSGAAGGASNSG